MLVREMLILQCTRRVRISGSEELPQRVLGESNAAANRFPGVGRRLKLLGHPDIRIMCSTASGIRPSVAALMAVKATQSTLSWVAVQIASRARGDSVNRLATVSDPTHVPAAETDGPGRRRAAGRARIRVFRAERGQGQRGRGRHRRTAVDYARPGLARRRPWTHRRRAPPPTGSRTSTPCAANPCHASGTRPRR